MQFFLLLNSLAIPRPIGLAAALGLLITAVPYIWPFQVFFALTLLFGGISAANYVAAPAGRMSILAVTFLLVSYVRPEFYVGFLLLCVCLLAYLIFVRPRLRINQEPPRAWPGLAATLILAFLLGAFMGIPIRQDNNRSFMAFGQHYAVNRVESGTYNFNPWTNYKTVMASDFDDAGSLRECVEQNPAAVLWHVLRNIRNIVYKSGHIAFANDNWRNPFEVRFALFGGAIALLFAFGLWPYAMGRCLPRLPTDRLWNLGLAGAGVLASTGPPILLIYPRDHYLLPAFMLVGAGLLLWGWRAGIRLIRLLRPSAMRGWSPKPGWIGAGCLAAALLGVATLPPRVQGIPQVMQWERLLLVKSTILAMRKLPPSPVAGVLMADMGLEVYVDAPWKGIQPWDRKEGETLRDFLARGHVKLIVDEYNLRHDTRFESDPDFIKLLASPQSWGFRIIPVDKTPRRLLLALE